MEAEVKEVHQRFADAPGQLLIDWATKHNYQTTLPHKDDWEAGLNAIRLLFRQNKIVISKACPFLATTLHSATFNKNKTDFERTEVLGHMDALAALVYANRMMDRTTNPVPSPTTFAERVAPAWMQKGKDAQQQAILADTLLNSFGKRKR